jgi:hypothetical protein
MPQEVAMVDEEAEHRMASVKALRVETIIRVEAQKVERREESERNVAVEPLVRVKASESCSDSAWPLVPSMRQELRVLRSERLDNYFGHECLAMPFEVHIALRLYGYYMATIRMATSIFFASHGVWGFRLDLEIVTSSRWQGYMNRT